MLNKKGQVGSTVTWIVATLIIIVMLIFFIFGSSVLAESKKLSKKKGSIFSRDDLGQRDLFLEKSIFTYYKFDSEARINFYLELEKLFEEGFFLEPLDEKRTEIGGEMRR